MLGEKYAVIDQDLASGKIDRAEYAGALLGDLLNRAAPFCKVVDWYLEDGGDPNVMAVAMRRFEADCREAAARGGRAGLFKPGENNGLAFPGPVSEVDVKNIGGLLVPERQP